MTFTKKMTNLCLRPFKRLLAPERYEKYDKLLNEKIDNFYRESLQLKANYRLLFKVSLITLIQLFFSLHHPIFYFVSFTSRAC